MVGGVRRGPGDVGVLGRGAGQLRGVGEGGEGGVGAEGSGVSVDSGGVGGGDEEEGRGRGRGGWMTGMADSRIWLIDFCRVL